MPKRKILVDDTRREISAHGTETFPMTVNHDDLWSFEGRNVPIHWHNDLEISLPREGEAIYQVYQKTYRIRPGEGLLLNRNVPHSCSSPDNHHARYSTILVRPDFLYGDFGSDVERNCFRPFLENSAVPCIYLTDQDKSEAEILQKLNLVEELFDQKPYCYELEIKGLLCEVFSRIFYRHRQELNKLVPANLLELERLEKMLNYLNMHFAEVISLSELADQVHLSREVCCRLFKKMTGKTITEYLEEYRVNKSFSLVQSGQYSMTQIADMAGFSNASRFASAFRKMFGCNPGEYNSLKQQNK
ncbi:AraC family transcriptional regulator [Blautia sp. HCP28S3_G10]|uniref:AraC family transcriptional regulator n=1 Tax=Blautia sp. HCP28S3_G10 TaxID=3438908 RepID=UPI003F8A63E4